MITEYPKLFGYLCQTNNSGVLYRWNQQSKRMTLVKSPKARRMLLMKLCIHSIVIATLFVQGIATIESAYFNRNLTFADKIIYGCAVILTSCQHLSLWAFYIQAEYMTLYVNGVLDFHARYGKPANENKAQVLLHKIRWFLVTSLAMTPMVLPIGFAYGIHWGNPCKPSLVGYWALPECTGGNTNDEVTSIWNQILKQILLLANWWYWFLGTASASFGTGGLQIMCTLSLGDCIKIFRSMTLKRQINVRESTNMYRNIQVVATYMQKLRQDWLVTLLIVCATLLQSFSLTSIIVLDLKGSQKLAYLLTLATLWLESMGNLMLLLGAMASIHTNCKHTFDELKSDNANVECHKAERRLRSRFYQSCALIKVRFGTFNFVDKLTALNCVDFGNDLTINLLLLKL